METKYKQILGYIKDAVFVVSIVSMLIVNYTNGKAEKALIKQSVDNNTKAIEKLLNNLTNQATINGKILQHIDDDNCLDCP